MLPKNTEDEVINILKASEVFIMNVPKNNQIEESNNMKIYSLRICDFIKKNGRCANKEAKYFGQHCKSGKCKWYSAK